MCVHINTGVRQRCCNTASEDCMRVYEFLRDLLVCRDRFGGKDLLNRDDICHIIKFLAVD